MHLSNETIHVPNMFQSSGVCPHGVIKIVASQFLSHESVLLKTDMFRIV